MEESQSLGNTDADIHSSSPVELDVAMPWTYSNASMRMLQHLNILSCENNSTPENNIKDSVKRKYLEGYVQDYCSQDNCR